MAQCFTIGEGSPRHTLVRDLYDLWWLVDGDHRTWVIDPTALVTSWEHEPLTYFGGYQGDTYQLIVLMDLEEHQQFLDDHEMQWNLTMIGDVA